MFLERNKKGFTLIEMLVVVAIIGILSSVLLTALGPARDKAKDSRIIQEANQARSFAETLYNGNYSGLEELPADTINNETLRSLSDDITKQGGALVIRKSPSVTGYVMYSPLNLKVGTAPDLETQDRKSVV